MRKHHYIFVIFLFPFLLLPGCIGDDLSDCPASGDGCLDLLFTYSTLQSEDEFAGRIDQVDLLLFSEKGTFMERFSLRKERLDSLPGISLWLPPGSYYLVGWGNMKSHSSLSVYPQEATLHNIRLYHQDNETTDSLYYAPRKSSFVSTDFPLYEVVVPEKGSTEKILDFMTAYFTVNVSVSVVDHAINKENLSIMILNLSEGYDMHLAPQATTARFVQRPVPVRIDNQEVLMASFHTPHFENENPVEVHIYDTSQQTVLCSISMQQFLSEYSYFLRAGNYTVIDIHVEISPGGITVMLPSWSENGLVGEY